MNDSLLAVPRFLDTRGGTLRRIGWGVMVLTTLTILVLPERFDLPAETGTSQLMLTYIAWASILFLFSFLGITLLVLGYIQFFQRFEGILLFTGLILLGVWAGTWTQMEEAAWLRGRAQLLMLVLGVVSMLAIAEAIALYLIFHDRGIRLLGVVLMVNVWVLFLWIRQVGPDTVLIETVISQRPLLLRLFQSSTCVSIWITILAPISFIGHTIRLLHHEREGKNEPK